MEFLKILRETRPGMPVIIGTGHLDEATARELKRDPNVCCLLKPYTRLAVGQKLLAIARLPKAGSAP